MGTLEGLETSQNPAVLGEAEIKAVSQARDSTTSRYIMMMITRFPWARGHCYIAHTLNSVTRWQRASLCPWGLRPPQIIGTVGSLSLAHGELVECNVPGEILYHVVLPEGKLRGIGREE